MLGTATKPTTLCSLATFKQWLGITSNATKPISSLTSVGTMATAVCTGHGYPTGACVQIAGAVQATYNGPVLITVVDPNTFTFPLPSAATSPATGTPTVTIDDGRYATMIDDATAELEQLLDVPFVLRSITETFSGDGKGARALANNPITSIDSFTMDGSPVDPSAYSLNGDTGVITFFNDSFHWGVMNVVITYVAGYDAQDGQRLPSDIFRAGLDLAKAIHDELVANAISASTVSLGASTMVIKPADYPPSVKRVMANWSGVGARA